MSKKKSTPSKAVKKTKKPIKRIKKKIETPQVKNIEIDINTLVTEPTQDAEPISDKMYIDDGAIEINKDSAYIVKDASKDQDNDCNVNGYRSEDALSTLTKITLVSAFVLILLSWMFFA